MKPGLQESEPGSKQFGLETETLTKQHHQWLKKNPKKSIPLPLGVREPAQSWRLRFLTVIFSQGPLWGFADQTNRAGSWSGAGKYRCLLKIGL